MCGIAGVLIFRPCGLPMGNLQLMLKAMRHRGPDDEGLVCFAGPEAQATTYGGPDTPASVYFSDTPYAPKENFSGTCPDETFMILGHRRLAIIDLTPAGHQPMCTEDGRYWIIYNGEAYNFREIRDELIKAGETFISQTDTEVVLKAYRRWGPESLKRFNGMWALAIWDAPRQVLFCARDRIGIKPFYYYLTQDFFLFASDIKTLIASELYRPEPDWEGVYHAMSFYCAPRPLTCFQGVRALRQGHWLRINRHGQMHQECYWQMPVGQIDYHKSDKEWEEELEFILRRAVTRRLVADVPVGTFMSGGIDSSTMTAISAQEHPGIKAFTLAFEAVDTEFDELPQAQATAHMYQLEHIIKKVRPEETLIYIEDMVRGYEEPFPSLAPNFVISQLVAENGVKVILNGLGPDELMGGYRRDRWLKLWRLLRPWRKVLAAFLITHPKWRQLLTLAGAQDIFDYYVQGFASFTEAEKQELFSFKETAAWDSHKIFKELYGLESLPFVEDMEALSYMDMINYIGNHHVYRVDQFTMHFSLEGRFPYLDYELVELACRMPGEVKVRHGAGKYILRRVAQKYISPASLAMKKKVFGLPVGRWMQNHLKPLVKEKISALGARDIFRDTAISSIYKGFYQSQQPYQKLWFLVSLEMWLEEFID